MTSVAERCHLPYELAESLQLYESAVLPESEAYSLLGTVLGCLGAFQRTFVGSCERLYSLPEISAFAARGYAIDTERWPASVLGWAKEEQREMDGWSSRHPECLDPALQLRTSGMMLSDFGAQMGLLAARSSMMGAAAVAALLYDFRSAWSMALYFVTCLQYLSLYMFEPSNELAYLLHRGRAGKTTGGNGQDIWRAVSFAVPTFRLDRRRPLYHKELSGTVVTDIARRYLRLEAGRLVRFVEIGVFRANLSSHVWNRLATGQSFNLQMHLVDHWGAAHVQPKGINVMEAPTMIGVGTGSNMAGASNSSLFHALVRKFGRTARCVQVPYWLPGGAPRAIVHLGGDVFFHRTTSVGAAQTFDDGSLDMVYIDADHKWWSVLQDIAAWWPKLRTGGTMMGHDFHLNSLMEREGDPLGNDNDVPLVVFAFFRAPLEVVLHSNFVWSVKKPEGLQDGLGGGVELFELCSLLHQKLPSHDDFEVCT